MPLIAYALGRNIVAATSPEEAVAVMDRHEPPGRWALHDVHELSEEERYCPVDEGGREYIADALARCEALAARARVDGQGGQLIRWDYPSA